MKAKGKNHKGRKNVVMRAKLTFDEGFAENPLYRIKAFVTEKEKGISMMELVQRNFQITDAEWRKRFRDSLEGLNADAMAISHNSVRSPIAWTRDEKGNIASPFRTKKKEEPEDTQKPTDLKGEED